MQNELHDFNNLNNAFAVLNSLINIKKMTALITELNTKLTKCSNKLQQVIEYNDFCTKQSAQNVN